MQPRLWCAILGAAGMASSQTPAVIGISGAPSCTTCRVVLTRATTLSVPDSVDPIGHSPIAIDSAGRIYAVAAGGAKIYTFDKNGHFTGSFGKMGQGPGEIGRVSLIGILRGDSLFVVDGRGVMSVFGSDHQFARSVRLPRGITAIVPQADGSVIIAATAQTSQQAGYSVHVVDSKGQLIRSIGWLGEPLLDPRCRTCTLQRLNSAEGGGRAWIIAGNRYAFDLWTAAGPAERRFQVNESGWFSEWNRPARWLDGTEPRNSEVLSVFEDGGDRLWIAGVRAPDKLAKAPLPAGMRSSNGAIGGSIAQLDEFLFDAERLYSQTVVDVLDLKSKRVLASTRLPGSVHLLSASTAYAIVRDANDIPSVEVYKVSLAR